MPPPVVVIVHRSHQTRWRSAQGLRSAGRSRARCSVAGPAMPLGRLAEPTELADTICYLVSDQASYITGATLRVDGGVSF